jgi:peptidoglycan/LPS O-acetylase OafA/YrhL
VTTAAPGRTATSFRTTGIDQFFPDAAHRPSARDLPSLDGLRALSITFVILGHAIQGGVVPLVDVILSRLANFGVCVFFVISGFLITTLLSREAESRGGISLRRFYLRRTLRIFPPYYAYLLTLLVGVYAFGWEFPPVARLWPAFTYTTNLFATHYWLTLHAWSLSIEEQFYVTWPIVLALLLTKRGVSDGLKTGARVAAFGLLMFPILRIIIFVVTRDGNLTGGLIFDYVAAGSAVALFVTGDADGRVKTVLDVLRRSRWTPLAAAAALVVHLLFQGSTRWRFAIAVIVATPLEAVLLAVFIVWAVSNASHPIGKILNLRLLRIVGIGSYSLYLWQQLFFGQDIPFARSWPVSAKLGCTALCALLSYFCIERPALRLRSRLEHAITRMATCRTS